METTEKAASKLSFGKQIWVKYFKWIVVALVILIFGIGYYIYSRGKKDTLANIPKTVPYPKDTGIATEDIANKKWIDAIGVPLGNELGNYLSTWHITNIGISSIIVNKLQPIKDWQLVFINNYYNANYATRSGGSLIQDLNNVIYVGLDGVRKNIVNRLYKLGAK